MDNIQQLTDIWEDILNFVRKEFNLTDTSFNTWLKPLKPYSLESNTVFIKVPKENEPVLNFITTKYTEPLQVAIKTHLGNLYGISFIVNDDKPASFSDEKNTLSSSDNKYKDLSLNSNYTFDTFVVGNNNRFAHSAALAVAEAPGEVYNPLLLYGGVGLGKTHLMQSIAHYIKMNNPSAIVRFVSSEVFTNELIDSIRNNKNQDAINKFREKYRNVDALLIDDIQFIIGKDATQEEFFHTFNELHTAKKQIVISSDRPPKDIKLLEDRIRTRLDWGLLADIGAPDYETRMAILKKKEELDNFHLSEEILDYIATNITSNIRELEGSLNRLQAYSRLEHCDITLDIATRELQNIIFPSEKKSITPEIILAAVCDHFNVSKEDILSSKRPREIARPRQIAMYLCQYMTNSSQQAIASFMNKDHSTVHHGINLITKSIETDDSLKKQIEILKKKINPS